MDQSNQLEEIGRTPMPITPRQPGVTGAGPVAFVAQYFNNNKTFTNSPGRARHGRSRSMTEGGSKSDFFALPPRSNNNSPADPEPEPVTLATPEVVTPSTSPRGAVVRVPPNTPAKSPGQELVDLRARVKELEQQARDASEARDTLRAENERLTREGDARATLSEAESEQLLRECDDMRLRLTEKEEALRVLRAELEQKRHESDTLTHELEPWTNITDLKARVTELESTAQLWARVQAELEPYKSVSELKDKLADLDFVQQELQAANETAQGLTHQLEERDGKLAALQPHVTLVEAEIARLRVVAHDMAELHDESESLHEQLKTAQSECARERERADHWHAECEHVTGERATLTGEVQTLQARATQLEEQLRDVREQVSRAESAHQSEHAQHEQLRTQHEQTSNDLAAALKGKAALESELHELKQGSADTDTLRTDMAHKEQELTRVKASKEELQRDNDTLRDQLKMAEMSAEQLTDTKTRLQAVESALLSERAQSAQLRTQHDRASSDLAAAVKDKTALASDVKQLKEHVTQLEQRAAQTSSEHERVTRELSAHHEQVAQLQRALHGEQERGKTREQEHARLLAEAKQHGDQAQREASKKVEQRASEHKQALDAATRQVKQLETDCAAQTRRADEHVREATQLRTQLASHESELARLRAHVTRVETGSMVPPHKDLIAELQDRSRTIKSHVLRLKTKSATPSKWSLVSTLLTVLLIALALVLGLAATSRDQVVKGYSLVDAGYHRLLQYAQQYWST